MDLINIATKLNELYEGKDLMEIEVEQVMGDLAYEIQRNTNEDSGQSI